MSLIERHPAEVRRVADSSPARTPDPHELQDQFDPFQLSMSRRFKAAPTVLDTDLPESGLVQRNILVNGPDGQMHTSLYKVRVYRSGEFPTDRYTSWVAKRTKIRGAVDYEANGMTHRVLHLESSGDRLGQFYTNSSGETLEAYAYNVYPDLQVEQK